MKFLRTHAMYASNGVCGKELFIPFGPVAGGRILMGVSPIEDFLQRYRSYGISYLHAWGVAFPVLPDRPSTPD